MTGHGAAAAGGRHVRSLIATGSVALHPGAVAAYRSLHG